MQGRAAEHVRVVLVEPQGPRNVGSVARALKNFGLFRLVLVGGPDPGHPECRMMAAGSKDVLDGARRTGSLDEALEGCTYVVGTTGRRRDRLPTAPPREAAPRIVQEAARGEVALVFGREDHGLTREELRRAHEVVAVEVSPGCRALNLAQAVLLLAYEVFNVTRTESTVASSDAGRLVTREMAGRLRDDLLEAMSILGLLHGGTEEAYRQSMERLLTLGPMQTRDARLLFALARRVRQLRHVLEPRRGPKSPMTSRSGPREGG